MGAGKSVIGKELSKRIGYKFVDTDSIIEKKAKKTVTAIFAEEGEGKFREMEKKVIKDVCLEKERVIATGGGAVLFEENVRNLKKSGKIVYLKVSSKELYKRLADKKDRPLLEDLGKREKKIDRINQLLKKREKIYNNLADLIIDTKKLKPGLAVDEIIKEIMGTREINLNLGKNSYSILLGYQILDKLVKKIKSISPRGRVFIVTNKKIFSLYRNYLLSNLASAGLKPIFLFIGDGERYKNLSTVARLYHELVNHECLRSEPLITFGGGLVGDVGGFLAATYQRGIPLIHLPTTLLSMVDSSIGGKVGVNLPQAKNFAGAFYQPKAVFIETCFLKTLPLREWKNGFAEVIKYAFIADKKLFELIEANDEKIIKRNLFMINQIIDKCVRIKARVVERDELDFNLRHILNYGHTVGHAIESLSQYKKYSHGEAVSMGMNCAAKIAESLGMLKKDEVDRHDSILKKFHLPTEIGGISANNIIKQIKLDKKRMGEDQPFVLLKGIGQAVVRKDVPEEVIRKSIIKNFNKSKIKTQNAK